MSSVSETLKRINERLDAIEDRVANVENIVAKTDKSCDKYFAVDINSEHYKVFNRPYKQPWDDAMLFRLKEILDDNNSLINWERVFLACDLLKKSNTERFNQPDLIKLFEINNKTLSDGEKDSYCFPYDSIEDLKKSAYECLVDAIRCVEESFNHDIYQINEGIKTYQGIIECGSLFVYANIYYKLDGFDKVDGVNDTYDGCDLNIKIVLDSDTEY